MSEQLDIKPQARNANRHTPRGMKELDRAISTDGWIGAITTAADGETFDGSARVEVTAANGMLADPIVIDTDGSRPVVIRRTDIPSADDPRAVRLGLAANRIAALNLDFDPDVLTTLANQYGADVLDGLWTDEEQVALFNSVATGITRQAAEPVDPNELWQGMPEFEHRDLTAQGALTIRIFLKDTEALTELGKILGKDLTGRKAVWFGKQPRGDLYEVYNEA